MIRSLFVRLLNIDIYVVCCIPYVKFSCIHPSFLHFVIILFFFHYIHWFWVFIDVSMKFFYRTIKYIFVLCLIFSFKQNKCVYYFFITMFFYVSLQMDDSSPDRVKPKTIKLVFVASPHAACVLVGRHVYPQTVVSVS